MEGVLDLAEVVQHHWQRRPERLGESTNELVPRMHKVWERRIRDIRVCHPDEAVLFPRLEHRDGADLVRLGRTNGGAVRTDSPGVICANQFALCIHTPWPATRLYGGSCPGWQQP